MSETNKSILSHVSIGTNDFDRAAAFYDKVMPALGCRRIEQHPSAVAYGKEFPEFWVQVPVNGHPATIGNGIHISFLAKLAEAVERLPRGGIGSGSRKRGRTRTESHYGPAYYGCFVRDPDGHKIEASDWGRRSGL